MSLLLVQFLAALFFVSSLMAGIWLILHLVSLAATFEGRADLVPAEDARPRVSRWKIILAMSLLIGGAGACLLLAFLVAGMLPFTVT